MRTDSSAPGFATKNPQAVRHYLREMRAVKAELVAVGQSKDARERKAKSAALKASLKAKHGRKSKQSFDPNDLPSKPLTPDLKRTPKLHKKRVSQLLCKRILI